MNRHTASVAAAALALCLPCAKAQPAAPASADLFKTAASPANTQSADGWQLRAGNGDGRVEIKLSPKAFTLPNSKRTGDLSFTASAPLSSKPGNSRLGTLDGLSGGFELAVNYKLDFDQGEGFKALNDWTFDVGASVGRKEFDYFEGDQFVVPTTVKRTTTAVHLVAGYVVSKGANGSDWLLQFGAKLGRDHQSANDQTRCPGGSGGGLVLCGTGAFEPPQRVNTRKVWLEGRYLAGNNRWAISTRWTRDLETKVSGVYVPIFLVRNKADKCENRLGVCLNAGIDLSWVQHKGSSFGVFVGSDFSL